MSVAKRLLLIRHGETEGESSIRYHGSTDVALSGAGSAHMRATAKALPFAGFDRVVSSPLSRAWESAQIVAPGQSIELEDGFREIDFGRWEGLTRAEIESSDRILARDWLEKREGFEFPGGERRTDFRDRVLAGLERVLTTPGSTVMIVSHKGVIRTISEFLVGEPLVPERPELGEVVQLTRRLDGTWHEGRRASSVRTFGV